MKGPRPGTKSYYKKHIKERYALGPQGEMVRLPARGARSFSVQGTILAVWGPDRILVRGSWTEYPRGIRTFACGVIAVRAVDDYKTGGLIQFDSLALLESNRFSLRFKGSENGSAEASYYAPVSGAMTFDEYEWFFNREERRYAVDVLEPGYKEIDKVVENSSTDGGASAFALGNKYYGKKEYARAFHWYNKGADQGHALAQCRLAGMYASGETGVKKNHFKAAEWFRKAAAQGQAAGQNGLGSLYANGLGVAMNHAMAIEWFEKAAAQGNAHAQSNLGISHQYGRGVEPDFVIALHWYRKAAAQGHAGAQLNLGVMYIKGLGTVRDDTKATELFRKAAEQGNTTAQRNLRQMKDSSSFEN
jgi:TPR repeat protein